VFVAATCNNVTVLPPELIRKGASMNFSSWIAKCSRAQAGIRDSVGEAQTQSATTIWIG